MRLGSNIKFGAETMKFWKRTSEPEDEPVEILKIERPVWFLLIKVLVTGNTNQPWPWIAGSEAIVQMFVPAVALEDALTTLDSFLPSQELERVDTLRATRFTPDQDDPDIPGEYFLEPLQQAARTGECAVGIFIVSRDSAWSRDDLT
jgi:hypothetical protein